MIFLRNRSFAQSDSSEVNLPMGDLADGSTYLLMKSWRMSSESLKSLAWWLLACLEILPKVSLKSSENQMNFLKSALLNTYLRVGTSIRFALPILGFSTSNTRRKGWLSKLVACTHCKLNRTRLRQRVGRSFWMFCISRFGWKCCSCMSKRTNVT